MSGASKAAVAASAATLEASGLVHPATGPQAEVVAVGLLTAAHDEALGLDRSVCLADVVEALITGVPGGMADMHIDDVADYVAKRFGARS